MGGEVHGRVERVTEGWSGSVKVGNGLEGLVRPGSVKGSQGGLERVREWWRGTGSMERARKYLRNPGRDGEGQGGMERIMERAREGWKGLGWSQGSCRASENVGEVQRVL